MQPFSETFDATHNILCVLPLPNDGRFDWSTITEHIRARVAEGILNLELDLGRMPHIDSVGLGLIVGYNLTLQRAGGTFRLLVERQSPVHKIIQLMKMHLLVTVIETGT